MGVPAPTRLSWSSAVRAPRARPSAPRRTSTVGPGLFDGRGAERVAEELHVLAGG